jgi:hypothetical protein
MENVPWQRFQHLSRRTVYKSEAIRYVDLSCDHEGIMKAFILASTYKADGMVISTMVLLPDWVLDSSGTHAAHFHTPCLHVNAVGQFDWKMNLLTEIFLCP